MKKTIFVLTLILSAFVSQAQTQGKVIQQGNKTVLAPMGGQKIQIPNTQNISSDSTATDKAVLPEDKRKRNNKKSQ